jgi:hypothetical protein
MAAEEELAQGLVRRRVAKRPSDSVAGSSPALVSSVMEPIVLTKLSPDAAGAGRTAVGSPLLKPNRARIGKEKPHGCPHAAFLGAHVLIGFWHDPERPRRCIEAVYYPATWRQASSSRVRVHACP